MGKERLIAFFDAVLAIIMTILVLELDRPDELSIEGFLALRHSFLAYALSFFWLGSVWLAMNTIWGNVHKISRTVIWWCLIFLFFASFIPYATGLVSDNFDNVVAQAFYGIIMIATTVCNLMIHKVLDDPDPGNRELLEATGQYRRVLIPDIIIKVTALILALCVHQQIMFYGVLLAATYMQTTKAILFRRNGTLRF